MEKVKIINAFFEKRGHDISNLKGIDDSISTILNRKVLNKKEALKALELYYSLNLPILGGDVFYLKADKIDWTYDNWYIIRKKNEKEEDFLKRSLEESVKYIEDYRHNSYLDCVFLFDIIFDHQYLVKDM